MSKQNLAFLLLMAAMLSIISVLPSTSVLAAGATFVVTTTADGADANPGNGICATNGAVCTLRAAVEEANANAGVDTIQFNIGTGIQTIKYTNLLPIITDGVIIDGTSQPGYNGSPLIVLDGSLVDNPADTYEHYGLRISAGSSTVKGLAIIKFGGIGIHLENNGNNVIQNNYIGVNAAGTSGAGNKHHGLYLNLTPNSQILNNVISDNKGAGINIYDSSNLVIRGNIIGLTAAGTNPLGNSSDGIYITTWDGSSANITIGGAGNGQGNVISSNTRDGIRLSGSGELTENLIIQGNRIGTDLNGNQDRGNKQAGIYLYNGFNVAVGGPAAGEGNVISGNDTDGISISSGNGINVYGNFIGTNAAGNAPLGNGDSGIDVFNAPAQLFIGGTTPGMGNIISANAWSGIYLFGSSIITIQGNFIGTNPAGGALGNQKDGIYIDNDSDSNVIGGTAAGEANWIAYNNLAGVRVYGQANSIRGNSIVNNVMVGIDLRIAGVQDALSSPNVTPNDFADGDTGGNNLQNFPVLADATIVDSNLVINGTLGSTYVTTFTLDFYINGSCDVAGNGEGAVYIGSLENVTTDNDGNATFTATVPAPSAGTIVTATATDSGSNTSEFSACVTMNGVPPANTAPVVTSPGGRSSVEGGNVNLKIVATDAENDTLTYEAVNLPTGLVIDSNTGVITGTVGAGAVENSPYNVTVSVSDGKATTSISFTWEIFGNTGDTLTRLQPTNGQVITSGDQYAPKFQWTAQGGADWYHLYIADVNYTRVYLDTWYKASDVCEGTLCTTLDDIWLLNNGDYIWWMTYWNPTVGDSYTELYNSATFTMNVDQPVTGALTRTSPANGQVITDSSDYVSKFQWKALDGAEWYHLYVADADYTVLYLDAWYEASDVCEGTLCTALDDIWLLNNGDYVWWMTYWSPAVNDIYDEMYTSSTFVVNMGQPGALTGTLPNGAINSGKVTLQWNAEPNTLWYQVWTGPADYSETNYYEWVAAADVCSNALCFIEVPGTLTVGDYETWMQVWGPAGMSDWQLTAEYTVTQ